ncbi:long-chain fatty acid--CoA ligase [Sphingobium sp. B2]|uniref:long-chain fatty acid--CoA ligase n=1 Tax=Sphingobium sp. B2 TaxID=2583228 RepID=UPI0011A0198A|nr:long-chain fatty acid--CoA ligase [Sphingobium sp. B2]
MKATMMVTPLTTQMIVDHGARNHAKREISTFDGANFRRARYEEVALRARKLATALATVGVKHNDRVATYCWNHQEHFEAYLAVPAMGAVLHTLNVRLSADQMRFIMNEARDRVLILDACLAQQVVDILPQVACLEHVILVGGTADLGSYSGKVTAYEALITNVEPVSSWPALNENSAAVVCYTSGTTGNPKGVVYSHRSIFLHSLASMATDTFGICESDCILLIPPMFHSNAWGLPYSGWLAGSNFLLPAQHLQPDKIRAMIVEGCPTVTATVPTILNDLLRSHETAPLDMSSFRLMLSGGSAVSPRLIKATAEHWNIPLIQGWGMTETSPMCTLSHPPAGSTSDDAAEWRAKSGRPVPGMEVRIVDEQGTSLPHDGKTIGNLELRGPWVTARYHGSDDNCLSQDGWLKTGDAGLIDEHGYVQITDRVKDLIKSGGEWISSVDLENVLSSHPDISEVAVISVPDARWEERPLVIYVPRPGATASAETLRAWLRPQVAKLWVPEYWSMASYLPRTSVGKIDKRRLRVDLDGERIKYNRIADPDKTAGDARLV